MRLSKEKLQSLNHITTEEVKQDLINAKRELAGYEAELKAYELQGITAYNKVKLYLVDAKIAKGKEFIDELNQILNYRELTFKDRKL